MCPKKSFIFEYYYLKILNIFEILSKIVVFNLSLQISVYSVSRPISAALLILSPVLALK